LSSLFHQHTSKRLLHWFSQKEHCSTAPPSSRLVVVTAWTANLNHRPSGCHRRALRTHAFQLSRQRTCCLQLALRVEDEAEVLEAGSGSIANESSHVWISPFLPCGARAWRPSTSTHSGRATYANPLGCVRNLDPEFFPETACRRCLGIRPSSREAAAMPSFHLLLCWSTASTHHTANVPEPKGLLIRPHHRILMLQTVQPAAAVFV